MYDLRFRDLWTLDLLGSMPKYESVQWWRRSLVAGRHSIVVQRQQIDVTDIPHLAIFEVRRNNAFEFGGVVERRVYNAITREWTLSGRDLKGYFLSKRQINPGASEFDAQLGVVAETAMKHYVEGHLTAPSDATRDINGELDGITFGCQGTHGWGETVYKNGRWQRLDSVLAELGLEGNLIHDVVMDDYYQGYDYQVSRPTDATSATGTTPMIFSVSLDNVSEAEYIEDYTSVVNACYVLGSGVGAARTVREVKDATSITNDLRCEGHLDARQAEADNDRLDMAGNGLISQSLRDAVTARMQPLNLDPDGYRQKWDVGYDVTLDFNLINVQVDRRIEEVHAVLESPEQFWVKLGKVSRARV